MNRKNKARAALRRGPGAREKGQRPFPCGPSRGCGVGGQVSHCSILCAERRASLRGA